MGEYSYSNPSNRLRARRFLKSIYDDALAQARERLADPRYETSQTSAVFDAVAAHMTLESFDGIHIYSGPKGGWHADLTLQGMPAGISQVLGTPKSLPCSTREEAIEAGRQILSLMIELVLSGKNKKLDTPSDSAPFIFDDVILLVPIEMLETLRDLAGGPPEGYARQRLSEIRGEVSGGQTITAEIMESMTRDDQVKLHSVAAMALLSGFTRWPENVHVGPPGKTVQ